MGSQKKLELEPEQSTLELIKYIRKAWAGKEGNLEDWVQKNIYAIYRQHPILVLLDWISAGSSS